MDKFSADDSIETNLRSIYLLGANTATYKFALTKSLLDLKGTNSTFISLDDLTPIFAHHLLEHVKSGKKQNTSKNGSKLISALYDHLQENLTLEQTLQVVRAEGFKYVLDAFHNLPKQSKSIPFFDKALNGKKQGIILTDELYDIFESDNYDNFQEEVEGRWNLVESAWGEQADIRVQYDNVTQELFYLKPISNNAYMSNYKRKPLTPLRRPLNGYQKGKCFYCNQHIDIASNKEATCQVDHFLPHSLMHKSRYDLQLDEIWNLVLACKQCNGFSEKGARLPAKEFLAKLARRNEYLIESNLPIKETIIAQCGRTPTARKDFLNKRYLACIDTSNTKVPWSPKLIYDVDF